MPPGKATRASTGVYADEPSEHCDIDHMVLSQAGFRETKASVTTMHGTIPVTTGPASAGPSLILTPARLTEAS